MAHRKVKKGEQVSKRFVVKVQDPQNEDEVHEFSYPTENEELPIM